MTRQDIYEAVWASPVTEVAARLKLSPGTLRNACRAADVPVPGRGHWVRASIGKASATPKLTGNRDERIALRKGELFAHDAERPMGEAGTAEPILLQQGRTGCDGPDAMSLRLQIVEAASQRWMRQQESLAFLAQVLAATVQLPPSRATPLLVTLRGLVQAVQADQTVRDTITRLAASQR